MSPLKIFLALTVLVFAEAKLYQQTRGTPLNLCDLSNTNSTIQCYCNMDNHNAKLVRSASCYLVHKSVLADDETWEAFDILNHAQKVIFSNTRGVSLTYVPTKALAHLEAVAKVEIKHGNIENIGAYAFANLTSVEEIFLSDNQIKTLTVNAFAHHRELSSLGLDTNNIVEINRDVFVDLPSLEKLFLTNNKITTIHDKAFIHLFNLRELEIDRNSLFSLNSETFSGLKELQKLDLSGNNLEVIGDNTFLPLTNLKSLNLDGNKIQMLDEKAFKGLSKINVLSLAHNNLTSIENVKLFEGLTALTVLNFKSNQLVSLKSEVMAPILQNFYGNNSILDVEDNSFPCDCRLDWFMSLINKTENKHLKIATENLKCIPDPNLKEQWTKMADSEKTGTQVFDENEATEYDYYDESQLDGKLFYIDVRDIINCTGATKLDATNKVIIDTATKTTAKVESSPITTPKAITTTQYLLASKSTTNGFVEIANVRKSSETFQVTLRPETISENTVQHKYDQEMASDEARTEKMTKLQRSIQDDDISKPTNDAAKNYSCTALLLFLILCLRLYV